MSSHAIEAVENADRRLTPRSSTITRPKPMSERRSSSAITITA
jgi:hypothetical protein